jgi:hypothetical protein
VVGDLAYVADQFSGLRILDVSNPAAPVEFGALETLGYVDSVEVVGDLAYLDPCRLNPRIFDVSNPAAPVELSALDTSGVAYEVEVVGDLAYVAAGIPGVRIFDVSHPAAPLDLGALETPDTAIGVEVVGDLVYVADRRPALRIFDASNLVAPLELGALDTPVAADVEVVGGLVYVAAGEFGLRIMDFGPEYFPGQCGGPGFTQLTPNSSLESDVVCIGSLKTYWFSAIASESYAVRVATITGDPDLYGSTSQACIESLPTLGGGCSYESSTTPGVAAEEIQFTAVATGPYYIGVHGITDGAYQIEVPEPSRCLLLAAGLGCLVVLRRVSRRRQEVLLSGLQDPPRLDRRLGGAAW